jgi:hypothetical protein
VRKTKARRWSSRLLLTRDNVTSSPTILKKNCRLPTTLGQAGPAVRSADQLVGQWVETDTIWAGRAPAPSAGRQRVARVARCRQDRPGNA